MGENVPEIKLQASCKPPKKDLFKSSNLRKEFFKSACYCCFFEKKHLSITKGPYWKKQTTSWILTIKQAGSLVPLVTPVSLVMRLSAKAKKPPVHAEKVIAKKVSFASRLLNVEQHSANVGDFSCACNMASDRKLVKSLHPWWQNWILQPVDTYIYI